MPPIAIQRLVIVAMIIVAIGASADVPSGSWSSGFYRPDINEPTMTAVAWQDGIVVTGSFTVAGSQQFNGIAYYDGTDWSALGQGLTGGADNLCIHDGDLYAGSYDDDPVSRWDGESWTTVGGDARFLALASFQGHLHAVGQDGLFRLEGQTWTCLVATDDWARKLIVHDGLLLVGGEFQTANGVPAERMLGWDGSEVLAVYQGLPARPSALAVHDGALCATCRVQQPDYSWQSWALAWTDGAWQPLGDFPENMICEYLASDGERLLLTGHRYFSPYGEFLASWSIDHWEELFEPVTGDFSGIHVVGDKLWITGEFHAIDGVHAGNLAYHDGVAWRSPFPEASGTDGWVTGLESTPGGLLACGEFQRVGALDSPLTAVLTDTGWEPLTGWSDQAGEPLDLPEGSRAGALSAAGDQLLAGGYRSNGTLYFTAERDPGSEWHVVADWNANVFQVWGDWVYAGTDYSNLGARVLRRPLAGGAWETLVQADPGSRIDAMVVWNGQLVVGGVFDSIDGQSAGGLVAFDGESWYELAGGTDGYVYTMTIHAGDLVAGGWFSHTGDGQESINIARLHGCQWMPVDGLNDDLTHVHALTVHDGHLVVGGCFGNIGGSDMDFLAIHDGQSLVPLGGGTDAAVTALASHDGHLYVGGWFSVAGDTPSSNLACWTFDGTTPVVDEPSPTARPRPQLTSSPNPFNPTLVLRFELLQATPVKLAVHDARGRRVRSLVNRNHGPGQHTVHWDGRDDAGRSMPSGTYLMRLEAAGEVTTSKAVLVR